MKPLTCAAARRRLDAFHDGELPVAEQIAVGAHLEWCGDCAARSADLRFVGARCGRWRRALGAVERRRRQGSTPQSSAE